MLRIPVSARPPALLLAPALLCAALATQEAETESPPQEPSEARVSPPDASGGAAEPPPRFERDVYPLLDEYCARCHDGEDAEAGVDLLWHRNLEEAKREPELYRQAAWQLWKGVMPPATRPQPDEGERRLVLRWVDEVLAPAAPAPAPAARMRRLNNVEFRHAVRDLVGVDFPAREVFPADNVGAGFDTIGSALTLSNERFAMLLEAAERIAKQAVAYDDPSWPATLRRGAGELEGGHPRGGSVALYSRGATTARFRLPRAGRYRVRVQAWGQQAGPEACRMRVQAGGRALGTVEVPATGDEPLVTTLDWEAPEGVHEVSAAFLNDYYRPEDPDPAQRDRNLHVDWIEVEGPLDPAEPTGFQRALFARFPAALGEARRAAVLRHLATRAWRRPPAPEEVARLSALAPPDAPLAAAARRALEALLVSPQFLYRWDLVASAGPAHTMADEAAHALASRLSFFLWSSAPDEELLRAAGSGALLDPAERRRQVTRMLASPRARALAEGFAAQWLQLRRLARIAGDPGSPETGAAELDAALIAAMHEETLRLFEHVLRERRDARKLITADYSFVDARLAAHYGLAEPEAPGFQRVSLEHTGRRGVLGHASVLTITSRAERTSPVMRGKWILETLIGNPPPPPPPGVGTLDEGDADAGERSLRARLEEHRAKPECSSCHATMDPLGFGLERFGPRGQSRERAGGFPVDARGELPDGRRFEGARALAALLAADGAFLRCLTEKLATYALGRPMGPADRPWLQEVLDGLAPARPTIEGIIRGIIASDAFLGDAARHAPRR